MKIKLSKEYSAYLENNFLCLHKNDYSVRDLDDKYIEIDVSRSFADTIRDWAGLKLQENGFDQNYDLTKEGKILEDIVDLFFEA